MASGRDIIDNVLAGNVALSNNNRFNFGYFNYIDSKFLNPPPFHLEVDTTGQGTKETYLDFKDGSWFGLWYKYNDSNSRRVSFIANIKNETVIGTTPEGKEYTFESEMPILIDANFSVGADTITAHCDKVGLTWVITTDREGVPEDDVWALTYGLVYLNESVGFHYSFNYVDGTIDDFRTGLVDDSQVSNFLAGNESAPPVYPGDSSATGGGSGWFYAQNDTIGIPNFPTIQPIDFGFTAIYNPSIADMQNISEWLWSDDFTDNVKLNYVSPFENILGISMVALNITSTPSILRIANVNSGITVPKVHNQYLPLDCGQINIREFWGGFLDYNASYTIWLPFIGYRSLRPDDMVNGTIGVIYHIDLLTGSATCFIWTRKEDGIQHVLYTYSCNIFYNVAFSGSNYMNMYNQQLSATASGINNAVSSLGKMASGDILGGLTSLITGTAQSKLSYDSAKPDYGRGGNSGGNSGLFSIRYPYIIQSLPIGQTPKDYAKLQGIPSQVFEKLENLTGYTEIQTTNVSQLTNCTDVEQQEILKLLQGGVIL